MDEKFCIMAEMESGFVPLGRRGEAFPVRSAVFIIESCPECFAPTVDFTGKYEINHIIGTCIPNSYDDRIDFILGK